MINFKGIIEGHINELRSLTNLTSQDEEKVFELRKTICDSCPLKVGNTCNTKKYINKETKEAFDKPGPNRVKGCGCRLSAKQKSKNDKCPAGFWGGEFKK